MQTRCRTLEKKLAEKLAQVVGMNPGPQSRGMTGSHWDRIHFLEKELQSEKANKTVALEANEHLLGKIREREAVLNRLQTDIDALQASPV